ncbi:hypothetical protein R6Q59_026753 [Mikania micrantha]
MISEAVEEVAMGGSSSRFVKMTSTFFNSICKSACGGDGYAGDSLSDNRGVGRRGGSIGVYDGGQHHQGAYGGSQQHQGGYGGGQQHQGGYGGGQQHQDYELRGHKISVGMAEKPAPKAQPSAYGQGFLCSLCSCFIFWKLLKKLPWVDHQGF